MRIAVLSPVWFPVPPNGYGGIEWIVSLLADGLVEAGHEVTLFASGDSLPSVIAFQWGEATTEIKRSALIAMGLTLFLITIVINLLATAVVNRATKRVQGT